MPLLILKKPIISQNRSVLFSVEVHGYFQSQSKHHESGKWKIKQIDWLLMGIPFVLLVHWTPALNKNITSQKYQLAITINN